VIIVCGTNPVNEKDCDEEETSLSSVTRDGNLRTSRGAARPDISQWPSSSSNLTIERSPYFTSVLFLLAKS
jgi:hypothetical protein